MELTEAQYACIESYLPMQRGNVRVLLNLQVLNAGLYVAETDASNAVCLRVLANGISSTSG